MKIKVTNFGKVDVMVDAQGLNKVEDKVIIHPKNSVTLEMTRAAYNAVKGVPGLSTQVVGDR